MKIEHLIGDYQHFFSDLLYRLKNAGINMAGMPMSHRLEEERHAGAPDPAQAVLATVTADAIPHSRVISLREISPVGLLFFTQAGTRKVSELEHNPRVSLNSKQDDKQWRQRIISP